MDAREKAVGNLIDNSTNYDLFNEEKGEGKEARTIQLSILFKISV